MKMVEKCGKNGKIVSHCWPSSILAIAVNWEDQNKDGKVKSDIRFQRNRP